MKPNFRLWILVFLLVSSNFAIDAQTVCTALTSGSWLNYDNWSCGSDVLNDGSIVEIPSGIEMDINDFLRERVKITNYGIINGENGSLLRFEEFINYGTLNINFNFSFDTDWVGTIHNYGTIINGDLSASLYSSMSFEGRLAYNYESGVIINNANFTISPRGEFHNYGYFENNSRISLRDVIDDPYSFFYNYCSGIFVNNGFIDGGGTVTDLCLNQAPVADAGADQEVPVHTSITLDGLASYDPDNSAPLSYTWAEDASNPQLDLISNQGGAVITFTVNVPGTYIFYLIVNDGTDDSIPDSVVIHVLTPQQGIERLIDTVEDFNLQQGIDNSLDAKLDSALNALGDVNENNDTAAINSLTAFINTVEAQRGNSLNDEQANILIQIAQEIINSLGN